MSVGWVAGTVRARALDRHRLGADGVRAIAGAPTPTAARDRLRASAYADAVTATTSLAALQHSIWAKVVWDLRVLAGWLPAPGVAQLRTLAGYFEIENIESRLVHLAGGDELPTFDLGALGTSWPRVRDATSPRDLRERMRPSWPEPGSDDRAVILRTLRLEWARRLYEIDVARAWGAAAAALVVARDLSDHASRADLELARRAPQLGHRAASATNLRTFVASLPDSASWVFSDIDSAELGGDQLWTAEARWWRRLDRDGERLLRTVRPGAAVVIGAVARRLADAWRTTAALDLSSRGSWGEELFDVIT